MGPDNREKYLQLLDDELARKQESLASIEHGRNTAESAMTSHHDHLRSDLAQDYSILKGVTESVEQVRAVINDSVLCKTIQVGALFRANLVEEGEVLEAVVSPVKVTMDGIFTITPNSPLGQIIMGLQEGDAFFYGPDKDKKMLGLIEHVE